MIGVIILGASGHIASHVIEILIANDEIHLTLFLRNKNRLRNNDVSRCSNMKGDVLNFNQLKDAINGQNIVYAKLTGDLEEINDHQDGISKIEPKWVYFARDFPTFRRSDRE